MVHDLLCKCYPLEYRLWVWVVSGGWKKEGGRKEVLTSELQASPLTRMLQIIVLWLFCFLLWIILFSLSPLSLILNSPVYYYHTGAYIEGIRHSLLVHCTLTGSYRSSVHATTRVWVVWGEEEEGWDKWVTGFPPLWGCRMSPAVPGGCCPSSSCDMMQSQWVRIPHRGRDFLLFFFYFILIVPRWLFFLPHCHCRLVLVLTWLSFLRLIWWVVASWRKTKIQLGWIIFTAFVFPLVLLPLHPMYWILLLSFYGFCRCCGCPLHCVCLPSTALLPALLPAPLSAFYLPLSYNIYDSPFSLWSPVNSVKIMIKTIKG